MLRATVSASALGHILATPDALTRSSISRIVNGWCLKESAASRQIAGRFRGAESGKWGTGLVDYVRHQNDSMISLSNQNNVPLFPSMEKRDRVMPATVKARWPGPFNTRAMIADLPSMTKTRISHLISTDKQTLALLLNFAIRIDGQKTRCEIIRETSFALARPIAERVAQTLFEAMIESGWVAEEVGQQRQG